MNQVAVEALYSATYVENYLDSVENLPDDAQKYFSRIRELDIQYRSELDIISLNLDHPTNQSHCFPSPDYLRDADTFYEQWSNCPTSELETANAAKRSRAMSRMQQSLMAARELGDEKMQLAQGLQELIDHKTRQLDHDFKNLDYGQDELMQGDMAKDAYHFSNIASPVPNSPSATSNNHHSYGSASHVFLSSLAANGGGSAALVGGGNGERHSSSNSSHNGSSAGANGGGGGYGGGNTGGGSGSGKRARRVRTDAGDMGSSDSNLENNGKGQSSSYGNSSLNMSSGGGAGGSQQQHQVNRKGQQQSSAAVNASGKKKKRKTRVQGGSGAGMGASSSSTGSGMGSNVGGVGNSSGGNGNNNNNNNMSGINTSALNNNSTSANNSLASLHAAGRDMREDTPPQEDTIDPDEPTYCLCDQISFGEMILCDNDLCPIEWFHFSCVSLISKPKGKWYCPNCRGDRPNIMKNKAQFLKELERYNKEREEKT